MEHQKLIAASVIALAVTLFAIFSMRPIARRFGLIDRPDERKRHRGCIPLIGGLCFFIGTLAGLFYLGYLDRFVSSLMAGAGVIVVIGVLDDLIGLSVRARLLAEAAAVGLVIAASGYYIDDLGPLFGESTKLGLLGVPLTVVAVIGLINAYNMLDGIDGLAASVTMVTIAAILFFADAHLSTPGILLLLYVLFATLIPYLFVNLGWPDGRKIFMGDAGSMLIGFLLAWSLIYLSHHSIDRMAPVSVLWCVALPVMETFAVMYRRFKKGQSPFKPDRQHLHHLLLDAGLSRRAALLTIVSAAGSLAMFGYALRNAPDMVNAGAFMVVMAAYVFWLPQLKLAPPGATRQPPPSGPDAPDGRTQRPGAVEAVPDLPRLPAATHANDASPVLSAFMDAARRHEQLKALCVISTPSESIALAPVAQQISQDGRFESTVCVAAVPGQEAEDVLQLFNVRPELTIELDADATGSGDVSRALGEMERVLDDVAPDIVLVPADAPSALVTTLAAYHRHIPVVCVETSPPVFAEAVAARASDATRRIVRTLASLHMTSSRSAHRSLVAQGVPAERILIASDTADALYDALERFQCDTELSRKLEMRYPFLRPDAPLLLVPETPGAAADAEAIAGALHDVARRCPGVDIVCVVDREPEGAQRADGRFGGPQNLHTIATPDYLASVYLLRRARVIVGGSDLGTEAAGIGKSLVIVGNGAGRPTPIDRTVMHVPADRAEIVRRLLPLLGERRVSGIAVTAARRHNGSGRRQHLLDALARMQPDAPADAAQFAARAQAATELSREET